MAYKCPLFKVCAYAQGKEPKIELQETNLKWKDPEIDEIIEKARKEDYEKYGIVTAIYKCSALPEGDRCLLVPWMGTKAKKEELKKS